MFIAYIVHAFLVYSASRQVQANSCHSISVTQINFGAVHSTCSCLGDLITVLENCIRRGSIFGHLASSLPHICAFGIKLLPVVVVVLKKAYYVPKNSLWYNK